MRLQRIETPPPFGAPPRQGDVGALVSRAAFGRIVDRARAPGRDVARTLLWLRRSALDELAPLLRIREGASPVRCTCRAAPVLELFAAGERIGALALHHGLALGWEGWNADAELAEGRELARWLAERGMKEPLAALDEASGAEEAEARRQRWLAATPPALAPLRDAIASPAGAVFGAASLFRVEEALRRDEPDPLERARTLLSWLGHDAGSWSAAPPCTGTAVALLALLGDAVTTAIAAGLPPGPAALGAARFVVETTHTRAEQRDRLRRLGAGAEALLEAARAAGVAEDLRRLERVLEPGAPAAPEGTRLIGFAQHGRLSHVCRDGGRVFALDGSAVVRFEPDAPEPVEMFTLPGVRTPLFARDGQVFFCFGGGISALPAEGGTPAPARVGLLRRLPGGAIPDALGAARWRRARRREADDLLGRGAEPVFVEVDQEEVEAREQLRAVGAPVPRALADGRVAWYEREATAVGFSAGARAGKVELGATVVHLAAGDLGIAILVERAPGEHEVARLGRDGGLVRGEGFAVEPGTIAHVLPAAAGTLVVVEAPLGDLLVEVR